MIGLLRGAPQREALLYRFSKGDLRLPLMLGVPRAVVTVDGSSARFNCLDDCAAGNNARQDAAIPFSFSA